MLGSSLEDGATMPIRILRVVMSEPFTPTLVYSINTHDFRAESRATLFLLRHRR